MFEKTLRGVIHSNVIELDSDAGLADGEPVEVIVRRASEHREQAGNGLLRTEGALADDLEWDVIMDEIHQSRKRERQVQ